MSDDVLVRIIDHARQDPQHIAVTDLDRALTYSELIDETARAATGLTRHGIEVGDRVALHMSNSVDFVVAALACMWCGAVFVPLSRSDPRARLLTILDDCSPALVVSEDSDDDFDLGRTVVSLSSLIAHEPSPAPIDTPARPVYAIYTSGTTGTPKGVLIGSRAFAAAVDAAVNALNLGPQSRALAVSPFHFDGSYGTLFPTLGAGGTLVIRPRDALLVPRTFFNTVRDEKITHTGFSPSYLKILLSSPQMHSLAESTLELIALGGEASSASDVRALWDIAPSIRILNRYGPTESTIAVTHGVVTRAMVDVGPITIGQPHPGVVFVLVDDSGAIIHDPNVVGELYVGGDQLMECYWGAPQLTNTVIREDIIVGERFYRTGDLVYLDGNGDYVYVDRADRVLKRSGVRISLVELSEAMAGLDGVAGAACIAYDDNGDIAIAAFVVCEQPTDVIALQRAARDFLPDTMLPNVIVPVEELPLTNAGKLDERTLLRRAGLDQHARPQVKAT